MGPKNQLWKGDREGGERGREGERGGERGRGERAKDSELRPGGTVECGTESAGTS